MIHILSFAAPDTVWNSLPVVVAAAVTIFGFGFVLLKPLLTGFIKLEVGLEEGAPIPEAWRKQLEERLPVFTRLNPAQQTQLLKSARELITTVRWEGCGGLTLSNEIQLIISAQAALLALELPADSYADLQEILVYPTTMLPQRFTLSRSPYGPTDTGDPILGEAWKTGTVVISWDAAVAGAEDPDDGHNTVLHEFAHILDFRAGLTIGTQPHPSRPVATAPPEVGAVLTNREAWHKLITENYAGFCAQVEASQPSVIDEYGTTNESEFFAVATEVFFERPTELKAQYPELYAGLKFFYRQDPELLHH